MTREHDADLADRLHRALVAVAEATPIPPPRPADLHALVEIADATDRTDRTDGADRTGPTGRTDRIERAGRAGHGESDAGETADAADGTGTATGAGPGAMEPYGKDGAADRPGRDNLGDVPGVAGPARPRGVVGRNGLGTGTATGRRRQVRRGPLAGGRPRSSRRRAAAGVAASVAAVAVLVAAIGVALTRPGSNVRTGNPPPPTTGPEVPTVREGRGGLTVSPASGLRDGDTITLSLDPRPEDGEVMATQCAAEAVQLDEGEQGGAGAPTLPDHWCESAFPLGSPAGSSELTMPVSRTVHTPSGVVDCASAPGRCAVTVGVNAPVRGGEHTRVAGPSLGYRYAPLVFADGLPPIPTPTLHLDGVEGDIEDGDTVRVVGRGFPASPSQVGLRQCIGQPDDMYDDRGDASCDMARGALVPVAADGTLTADFRVFREVAPSSQDVADQPDARLHWTACQPCVLVAGDAVLPLEVTGTDDPIRPRMRVTPDGPYQSGQQVRIEGEGFQAGQEVGIASCVAGSWQTCGFPEEGFPHADADGRFAIEAYPLPSGPGACISPPGCVLAWAPSSEGAPPGIIIPLDFSPGAPPPEPTG